MSKIDKIKNYNQVLLAIAGTIGVIFIFFAALISLSELSGIFFREDTNNGILATEETDKLLEGNQRKQIISFDNIQIIDSTEQVYLMPVAQANLAQAESATGVNGFMESGSYKFSGSYRRNIYNNLVVYNSALAQSKLIFDQRVSIDNYRLHKIRDKKYITIAACSTDSNKDGFLNDKDLQTLFIYEIKTGILSKIEAKENYTTLNAYQPRQSEDLVVHFGIDRNNNGKYEGSIEPMIFYKINLEQMVLEDFISQKELDKLQELLDGK